MKILICGSQATYAIEPVYARHLRQLGADARLYPSADVAHAYSRKHLGRRLLHRLGWPAAYRVASEGLVEAVRQFNPQVLWVFKGMELLPDTLAQLRQQGLLLANFNPDHPFVFSGRGSGNALVRRAVPLYHLHFCYAESTRQHLAQAYGLPALRLPFGYHDTGVPFAPPEQEVLRACFVGNPDAPRAQWLKALLNMGLPVDVYGNHWGRHLRHPLLQIHPPVYGPRHAATLLRYRVQLNLMRPHNPDSHNMRSFEVPAVGGLQVAPDTPDHRGFFVPQQHIWLFQSVEECAQQVRHLLALPPQQAAHLRLQAWQHCRQEKYSYAHRAQTVLAALQNALHDLKG